MTKRELVAIFGGKASGWTKHKNGGGWKYKTAAVADSAVIGPDALVSGNAWVSGNARVYGNAEVSGDAQVCGSAWVAPVLSAQHTFCMNISSAGVLRIGCEHQTFAEWEKNGEQIARKHGELQWYKTYAKPLIPFFEAENERLFGKARKVEP